MSLRQFVRRSSRILMLALAAGAAVFAGLVVLHPFDIGSVAPAGPNGTVWGLHARIDAARAALRETEAALDNASPNLADSPPDDTQLEAQIAAVTERRDLALRHAQAIRDDLASGASLASLAEIRDSVLIGQLLAQQAALDRQLAEQGARLRSSHPTMRALLAQKRALVAEVKAQAADIAAALEGDAKLDDTQVNTLRSQLAGAAPVSIKTPAIQPLEAKAAAQRAELESLLDSYFQSASPAATQPIASSANPLDLLVAGLVFAAALAVQIALLVRRRRRARSADLARWRADRDPEIAQSPVPVTEPDAALRHAS